MSDIPSPPPPPPPENPFLTGAPAPEPNGEEEALDQGRPKVSARPGRVLVVVGIVIVILGTLLYNITGPKKKKEPKVEKTRTVSRSTMPLEPPPLPAPAPVIDPPPLPLPNAGTPAPGTGSTSELPGDVAPLAPPPIGAPALPDPVGTAGGIKPEEDQAAKQEVLKRLKSNIMVASGGGPKPEEEDNSRMGGDVAAGGDRNTNFQAAILKDSNAPIAKATTIGDMGRVIAQGRLIQATLESAINSDLPAPIRAIVSRDTYGEAGMEPLIPRGSRLIGTYNTDITGGQTRVYIVWTRLIRPDGVDIQIGSAAVDLIGHAGIGGQVDTKFQQIFSRSLLSTVMGIGLAIATNELGGDGTTTTQTGVGAVTTGDVATTAATAAIGRLGQTTDSFIQKFVDSRPTISVDQGTMINILVNRDLIFPPSVGSSARFVN